MAAKTMAGAIRDGLAPLLILATKDGASAAELDAGIIEAREAVKHAEGQAAEANRAYRAGLLSLDESALQKLVEAQTAANVRRDRAQAIVQALSEKLAEARNAEAETDRCRAYEAAKQAAQAAVKTLNAYPGLVDQFIRLMREVNEAEMAVEAVNRDLPRGATAIASPEIAVRGIPPLPRKVLHEETVLLWAREYDSQPLPEAYQNSIQNDGAGRGRRQGESGAVYVKRTFVRRKILPERMGTYPLPFAQYVRLPGFFHDELAFDGTGMFTVYDGRVGVTPQADVAFRLADTHPVLPVEDPRKDSRTPKFEFELVPAPAKQKVAA